MNIYQRHRPTVSIWTTVRTRHEYGHLSFFKHQTSYVALIFFLYFMGLTNISCRINERCMCLVCCIPILLLYSTYCYCICGFYCAAEIDHTVYYYCFGSSLVLCNTCFLLIGSFKCPWIMKETSCCHSRYIILHIKGLQNLKTLSLTKTCQSCFFSQLHAN